METDRDSTADPSSMAPATHRAPAEPHVRIAFHAELGRVGDELVLPESPLVIGRSEPLFTSASGVARPLEDSCISRRQIHVSWDPRRATFAAHGDPSARRSTTLYDPLGCEVRPGTELAPGSFVAIGDRALLQLVTSARGDGSAMDMIGSSDVMRALRGRILVLAPLDDTVLIRGETGSGKELVAHALHHASARRGPFVAVNCAALPEALIESELFGHVRGAFSGAPVAKEGLFAAARGGTLFLDEIGELAPGAQAKLLRALQVRKIRPVGGSAEVPIDARVVAATNRDLEREIDAGRFRADLYSRIEGLSIVVPPLRERRGDVPELFAALLQARAASMPALLARLSRPADLSPPFVPMELVLDLVRATFPHNVRQLEKLVAATSALNAAATLFRAPPLGRAADATTVEARSSQDEATKDSVLEQEPRPRERRQRPDEEEIRQQLEAHDYVKDAVARALGVPHTTLDRWLRELGIVRPRDLSREAIEAAQRSFGDVERMARELRVSVRGLKLRMGELGLST